MEDNPVKNIFHLTGRKNATEKNPARTSKGRGKQAIQLADIFDTLPEPMIITDQDGRIEQINRAAVALLGVPDADLEFQDWPGRFGLYANEALEPLAIDQFPSPRGLDGNAETGREFVLLRKGEEKPRWISMTARPILGSEGQPVGAFFLLQDITSRKLVELSRETYIRRIETLYRLSHIISESASDAKRITRSVAVLVSEVIGDLCTISLLSPDGRTLRVAAYYDTSATSRTLFRKVLGAMGMEFPADRGISGRVIETGKPVLVQTVSPEELAAVTLPEFQEFVRQVGVSSSLTVPLIGRSGVVGVMGLGRHRDRKSYTVGDQSFLLDIAYRTALALENGMLVESLRSEISERLSAERALGMSEERFRSIFESTSLGIKILDLGGNILHTNRAFQEMLGYSAAELVGRHFYDFLHPMDVSRGLRLFHDLKISGLPDFRFEHRAMSREGTPVWVKTTFTGVKKGGGDESLAFIVGIIENVTEQKRLEGVMAELNSRLQNSMELERLRLAQELHDGPMQELYNAIYRVEEMRLKVEPDLAKELEQVNHDVQRVLGDLRATAKELRPPTISSFGLEKAIRSHVEDFQIKHPEIKVRISLAQDGQLLPEEIRLALFRIVQQSLANIVRHANATEAQVRFVFDAEEATLEVRDNGQGFVVPGNWISLVREGHYGLAGAAERVNALAGKFTVQSELGKSTLIRAVIPWQKGSAEPAPAG